MRRTPNQLKAALVFDHSPGREASNVMTVTAVGEPIGGCALAGRPRGLLLVVALLGLALRRRR